MLQSEPAWGPPILTKAQERGEKVEATPGEPGSCSALLGAAGCVNLFRARPDALQLPTESPALRYIGHLFLETCSISESTHDEQIQPDGRNSVTRLCEILLYPAATQWRGPPQLVWDQLLQTWALHFPCCPGSTAAPVPHLSCPVK